MIVDLSNPPPFFLAKKSSISLAFLEEFNLFLEELYNSNKLSKGALLLPTLYTNTYVSPIYGDLENLYTLKRLVVDGQKLKKIVTSNHYLYKALKSDKNFNNVNIILTKKYLATRVIRIIKYFLFLCFVYLYSKFLPKNHDYFSNKKKLVFLEVFFSKKPENITDAISHYYPNVFEKLSTDELEQIVLLPSFYNVNSINTIKAFSKVIKESKTNSYFCESQISINNILAPYFMAKKSITDIKNIPKFLDINLAELLLDASNKSIYTRSSFYTYLRYCDLKNNNRFTNNHKIICWNENHGLDRAINLAFGSKEKPLVVGHQGLIPSKLKNSLVPRDYELKRSLWPNEMQTLFKSNSDIPNLSFNQAPAFRYYDFFHSVDVYEKKKQIFIGLNLNNFEALKLLDRVIQLHKEVKDKIIIRPHPLTLKSTLKYIYNELPFAVISKGEFKQDLAESQIFISHGDTSLYLQSFFIGTVSINTSLDYVDDTFLLHNTPYYKHTNYVKDIAKIYNSSITIDKEFIDFYKIKFKEPTLQNTKHFLFN